MEFSGNGVCNYYNCFSSLRELSDFLILKSSVYKDDYTKVIDIIKSTDIDPSFDYNFLLISSIKKNQVDVVKFLLNDNRVEPNSFRNLIEMVSIKGYSSILEILLKDGRCDPNEAITLSSINGHVECVKILMQDKRVDPSMDSNGSLKMADRNGHIEVVKLLLSDPRVVNKLSDKEISELQYKYPFIKIKGDV
jgi:hypothetical protein